jgi:hypothetical protein
MPLSPVAEFENSIEAGTKPMPTISSTATENQIEPLPG